MRMHISIVLEQGGMYDDDKTMDETDHRTAYDRTC
jgi:hypothetical protein